MIKRVPIFVSILVLAAVAIMVGLGIWQLQRADWKNGLLDTYAAASGMSAIAYPAVPDQADAPYFRKSSVNCLAVVGWRSTSGRSADGQAGWAHIAQCRTAGAEGPGAQVVAGWSERPDDPQWDGGMVNGIIAPDSQYVIRLVASEPVAGLQKSQPPAIDDIPNNHLSYAVQWFLFAGIALVIFLLALRGRNKGVAQSGNLS
ncbi:SURF1 family protein [Parasphingorhabdus sp.]|uniref:SURF1 family protein n=1 Tax=Parasphingorhabdus sp. TaxID=2709688 RepID=UPI002B266EA2|nr:SURF1 family protein [Parasphingorhabdus sp.]|tara:strand:+ start:606 stop:1211 length:606 start_codon:yes stop_codon:yes gene_type:complete